MRLTNQQGSQDSLFPNMQRRPSRRQFRSGILLVAFILSPLGAAGGGSRPEERGLKTFALGPSQEGEVGPKGELVLKTPWAFTLTGEGIFTIVNGEQNGYIHAIIGVGAARSGIRVANIDPTESGKIYLHSSERLRFSVPVKTEVVDPDGRKKKVKFEKVLRAGPGEQIAMVFTFPNHENQSATMMIAVEYYSDEGQLVGQTDAKQFSFSEDARTSQSWTFMKSDLVTH